MRVVAGVPPGPGGSCPGQFLAPETQHDIGGVGDALGMRHHDHAFADLMGCVLLLTEDGAPALDEAEQKLVQTVAGFLGRQMES